jgi:uncharacterized protein (TIGR02001 family)
MPHHRRRDRRTVPLASIRGARACACLCLACAGVPAAAQTSGSLGLVSEYVVRGISLSAGHPALQLRIDRDMADGWYLGGFASPAKLGDERQAELILYGGRAGLLPSGMSWDVGVHRATFLRDHHYDYLEFHAGLALDRASVRLFLSPAYYGEQGTAYLDLNAFEPLDERWRLTFHAGTLHAFGGYPGGGNGRIDLRLGVAAAFGDWSVEAGWQTVLRTQANGPPRARGLSGSAAIRF